MLSYGERFVCLCATSYHTHTQRTPIKKHRAFLVEGERHGRKVIAVGLVHCFTNLFTFLSISFKMTLHQKILKYSEYSRHF